MSAWTAPFRWFYAWIDRVLCTLLALLIAQLPVFTDQYLAALDHARQRTEPVYQQTVRMAEQLRLTPETYLAKLAEEATASERDSLKLVSNTLARHERYEQAYETLNRRPTWLRPLALLLRMDHNVRKTLDYQPQLPITLAGLIYALVGLTLGWLLMGALRQAVSGRKARPQTR